MCSLAVSNFLPFGAARLRASLREISNKNEFEVSLVMDFSRVLYCGGRESFREPRSVSLHDAPLASAAWPFGSNKRNC